MSENTRILLPPMPAQVVCLRGYAGKTRRMVRNPCLTARDSIAIGNWIAEVEEQVEIAGRRIAELETQIKAAIPAMREYAAKNPELFFAGTLQDPCGAHNWLVLNDQHCHASCDCDCQEAGVECQRKESK